jgi:Ca2+-binding EF-hand superfamily protein
MQTARAVGLALTVLAFSAGSVLAQNNGPINYQELFQELDANGDRIIDRGEVPDSGRAAFETLLKHGDSNKDGKLDQEEYRGMLGALRNRFESIGSKFAEFDRNGDGKISREEFAGPVFLFDRLDADGDGSISREEARKFQPGPGPGGGDLAQRLRAMDRNGDGKISKDEFAGPPQFFDRFDANKDGSITIDELRQVRPMLGAPKAKAKAKQAARPPAN